MLKWFFIDGWWGAQSKIQDSGAPLDWRSEWKIKVTKEGRFSVSHSSTELVLTNKARFLFSTHKETFATFEEAAQWCEELENPLHTQPAKEPVAEAITFDKCSPEVEAAVVKAVNEFVEEYKKLGVATKENSLIEEMVVVGEIPGVVRNTGNKHWDGQVVYLLEFQDSKSKCRVRSKDNGNITWVDTACLALPSI